MGSGRFVSLLVLVIVHVIWFFLTNPYKAASLLHSFFSKSCGGVMRKKHWSVWPCEQSGLGRCSVCAVSGTVALLSTTALWPFLL